MEENLNDRYAFENVENYEDIGENFGLEIEMRKSLSKWRTDKNK